jgi:hypothetical protein
MLSFKRESGIERGGREREGGRERKRERRRRRRKRKRGISLPHFKGLKIDYLCDL